MKNEQISKRGYFVSLKMNFSIHIDTNKIELLDDYFEYYQIMIAQGEIIRYKTLILFQIDSKH